MTLNWTGMVSQISVLTVLWLRAFVIASEFQIVKRQKNRLWMLFMGGLARASPCAAPWFYRLVTGITELIVYCYFCNPSTPGGLQDQWCWICTALLIHPNRRTSSSSGIVNERWHYALSKHKSIPPPNKPTFSSEETLCVDCCVLNWLAMAQLLFFFFFFITAPPCETSSLFEF